MRIEQIRLRNINSLRGHWCIDLSAQEGLFAIVGATGSGKTSILDALCLALYGQTPRVPKISNQSNALFRQDAQECGAEVVFSLQGERFHARWSQRRARGQHPFQAAKHELMDAQGRMLSGGLKDSAARIRSLLGMDFRHFTRTALLAQGHFAAFLQSNARERGELFEVISDSPIYRDISMAVYQRAKEEQARLTALGAEEALPLASAEEMQAWREERQSLERQDASAELEALYGALQREQQYLELKTWLAQQPPNAEALLQRAEAAEAGREIHRRWRQAEEHLQRMRQRHREQEQASQNARTQLEHLNAQLQQWRADWPPLEEAWQHLRQADAAAALRQERGQQIQESQRQQPDLLPQWQPEAEALYEAALNGHSWEQWQARAQQAQSFLRREEVRRNLPQLEREAAAARDAWQQWQDAQQRQSLAGLRAQLQEDQPCPLCGSRQHPYRGQQPPQPPAFNPEKSYRAAQEALHRQQGLLAQWADVPEHLDAEALLQQHQRLQTLRRQRDGHRLAQWQREWESLPHFDATAAAQLRRQYESLRQNLQEAEKEAHLEGGRLAWLSEEEQRGRAEVEQAEADWQRHHRAWQAYLQSSPFATEALFLAQLLSPEQWQMMRQQQAERQQRQQNLLALEAQGAGGGLEALQGRLQQLQQQERERIQRLAVLQQREAQQQEAQRRQGERAQQILQQQRENQRWRELSELIGAADGKRFNGFAQGITFERLLQQANRQLQVMNPRYRLIRRENEELEFDVLDGEQGWQRRSCQNLSGGENFLLSLALALALAQLNGERVQLDSLFLDEGFGTLDAASLDDALEALLQLHARGKMVGIISHVAGLRERLPQIIEVLPQQGAYSVLRGLGVSRLGFD